MKKLIVIFTCLLFTGISYSQTLDKYDTKALVSAGAEVCLGIHLTYRLEEHHDRYIAADNGWKITLGRGLDIFEKIEGRFNVADIDQTKRKCKSCELTFIRL